MVHGNHEGFAHLASIAPRKTPDDPVIPGDLPRVDSGRHIQLLPSGWRTVLSSGYIIGAVGGIEPGQREAAYHPMAYIDPDAVLRLAGAKLDVLITHQGPAAVQGAKGSTTLDFLLNPPVAAVWFHGHSTEQTGPLRAGTSDGCQVVPLGDIAFAADPRADDLPGRDGWALLRFEERVATVRKKPPSFLREFRRRRWMAVDDERLVAPPLARLSPECSRSTFRKT